MTPNLPTRDVPETTHDMPKESATSNSITAPKIKFGDAIKAIGQSVQGFELQITRDKTPIKVPTFLL